MLKAGANPNYVVKGGTSEGSSVMYFAAGGDSPELLKLLLEHKGNPNLVGVGGPLLHVAVMERRRKNIDLLFKYGADVNVIYGDEDVAATACALGDFELSAYFLQRGLNADLEDLAECVHTRRVPPHSEAQRWKDKVIGMLRERGIKYPPPDFNAPPPTLHIWGR